MFLFVVDLGMLIYMCVCLWNSFWFSFFEKHAFMSVQLHFFRQILVLRKINCQSLCLFDLYLLICPPSSTYYSIGYANKNNFQLGPSSGHHSINSSYKTWINSVMFDKWWSNWELFLLNDPVENHMIVEG